MTACRSARALGLSPAAGAYLAERVSRCTSLSFSALCMLVREASELPHM